MDKAPQAPVGFDLAVMLRSARRDAGLSQRELSRAAGTDRRTLERLESGVIGNVTLAVLLRLLGAAGARLQIVDVEGEPMTDFNPRASRWRDGAGRRQPAHLATFPVSRLLELPSWKNHDWRKPFPTRSFERRAPTAST